MPEKPICVVRGCEQLATRELRWKRIGMVDAYCDPHADRCLDLISGVVDITPVAAPKDALEDR